MSCCQLVATEYKLHADQAGDHSPEPDRHDRAGEPAQPGPPALHHPGRNQDCDGDYEAVKVQLERPDAQAAGSWAWDVADHAPATLVASGVPPGCDPNGKLWSEAKRR